MILIETNENENIIIQNVWDTAKVVLRGKFLVYKLISGKKKNLKLTL